MDKIVIKHDFSDKKSENKEKYPMDKDIIYVNNIFDAIIMCIAVGLFVMGLITIIYLCQIIISYVPAI